ncbi:MAG: hypothetical protein JO015_09175 [Verrucomicrobia bacterium]|nr:hypothetical protein [Verrucomicrobiota bacterium]
MDTATYAAVAVLPQNLRNTAQPVIPETEFVPLSWSYINAAWLYRFETTGSCNDV